MMKHISGSLPEIKHPPKSPFDKGDLEKQIACVKREVAMRKSVYAKRVKAGKMKKEDARREYDLMCAVLQTLYNLRGNKGPDITPGVTGGKSRPKDYKCPQCGARIEFDDSGNCIKGCKHHKPNNGR